MNLSQRQENEKQKYTTRQIQSASLRMPRHKAPITIPSFQPVGARIAHPQL
jgi:hypothetical protein